MYTGMMVSTFFSSLIWEFVIRFSDYVTVLCEIDFIAMVFLKCAFGFSTTLNHILKWKRKLS